MPNDLTKGFTLIELLLYLGLFPLLVSGSLLTAFTLNSLNNKINSQSLEQTEGEFISQKIQAAIQHSDILTPQPGTENNILKIQTIGLNEEIIFSTEQGLIYVQYSDPNERFPLNNRTVRVTGLKAQRSLPSTGQPEILSVEFHINEQVFSFTKYLGF
jgi:hypothetical protein